MTNVIPRRKTAAIKKIMFVVGCLPTGNRRLAILLMNARFLAVVFAALAAISPIADAAEKQIIEFADFLSGKVEIVGRLGIQIGRVVRVEVTVVSAEKVMPGFTPYREMYLLSIHTIDGRNVADLITNFSVNRFAVSKLFKTRSELTEKLQEFQKRKLTEEEIDLAEKELLSGRKRIFLVYECISFYGMPADMPPDVVLWAGFPFGPDSNIVVIKELDNNEEK